MVEEADETQFWLELMVAADVIPIERIDGLIKESTELVAIFVAAQKTARSQEP